jgi:hypothetical protein
MPNYYTSVDDIMKPICASNLTSVLNYEVLSLEKSTYDYWSKKYPYNYTRAIRVFFATQLLDLTDMECGSVLEVGADDDGFRINIDTDKISYYRCDNSRKTYHDSSCRKHFDDFCEEEICFDRIYVGHTFEHFIKDDDINFIRFLSDKLNPGGICCIEPLFLAENDICMWEKEELIVDDGEAIYHVVDNTSNLPGSSLMGMGFARIYSAKSLDSRILSILNSRFHYKLVECRIDNEQVPDMTKYKYKRKSINHPLRMLVIKSII